MASYRNPILDADWPDPDAIRVGDTYYLVASSFNRAPGLPLLRSTDLVHWKPIGHALPAVPPIDHYRLPRHGGGVWAPALRHHDGLFWIFYPDPDHGIFLLTATDPAGPWSDPWLLFAGRGLIDPCPLWDDDGLAYLVYGFAASRAGIKNILSICEMSPDATRLLGPGRVVIDGNQLPGYTTLEGPKIYRRDGWYWIFAPAGGVATGWQSVFRSRSIWGPYEDRIVLAQGDTDINGPHQGAWVDTPEGDHWFLHFQDRGVFGRVTHLQPMSWTPGNDWPTMGRPGRDGVGEPVREHPVPNLPAGTGSPLRSDDFTAPDLGFQWHWQANPDPDWLTLAGNGELRLQAVPNDLGNLRNLPQVLTQQLPGQPSVCTVRLSLRDAAPGTRAGLVVLGERYAWIGIDSECLVCRTGGESPYEESLGQPEAISGDIELRVETDAAGRCRFGWRPAPANESDPGGGWRWIAQEFQAVEGRWIGAEIGLFATSPVGSDPRGEAVFGPFALLQLSPVLRPGD